MWKKLAEQILYKYIPEDEINSDMVFDVVKAMEEFSEMKSKGKYVLKIPLTFYPERKFYIKWFLSLEDCNQHIHDIVYDRIDIKGLPPNVLNCKIALTDTFSDEPFTTLKTTYLEEIFKNYVTEIKYEQTI